MRRRLFTLLLAVLLAGGCAGSGVRDNETRSAAQYNVELGLQYMQEGMNQVAMEKFQKALRQDPELPTAHNAIAVLYESLGQIDQADHHFQRAVRLDRNDSRAHNNYGAFLCRQDRWEDAEPHFVAAASDPLYETPELVYANAGICAHQAGDLEKAELYLRKALEVEPEYPIALRRMAQFSLEQGQYLKVRAYLQRYQAVARHTPQTLLLGIRAEQQLGDRNAEASYRLLLRNNFPESPQARELFGEP
ncbi:MAG TPA: type IV pilus biogenesis/stability protein PilW [Thiohalobacter sp.]|nr:type IV pilus biogenesis/stability protein PilW [Thiohalobacter sp.]